MYVFHKNVWSRYKYNRRRTTQLTLTLLIGVALENVLLLLLPLGFFPRGGSFPGWQQVFLVGNRFSEWACQFSKGKLENLLTNLH
jgi:hypothetical protein